MENKDKLKNYEPKIILDDFTEDELDDIMKHMDEIVQKIKSGMVVPKKYFWEEKTNSNFDKKLFKEFLEYLKNTPAKEIQKLYKEYLDKYKNKKLLP